MPAPERADTSEVAIEAVRRTFAGGSVVSQPRKLAGGAMHDSWAVDGVINDAVRELVVRVSPAGRADHEKTCREFEVLKVAFSRGIRCPEPIAVGECESGEDYLLMARVGGDTNPRELLTADQFAESRRQVIPQLAEDLARIHMIRPADVSAAPNMAGPGEGQDPLSYQRDAIEERYRLDLLNPHPAIEWAFRWIDRQMEAVTEPGHEVCLVHGDFRIGNMLYDDRGLTSVLDWEGTHLGDREEDLSWFCTRVWRFARPNLDAGGIASREEWITAYERASGCNINRQRIAVWEVLHNIRWCQITMMQARAHLDGHTNSHELAAIGRRTAETELEILKLTGVAERVRRAG